MSMETTYWNGIRYNRNVLVYLCFRQIKSNRGADLALAWRESVAPNDQRDNFSCAAGSRVVASRP